MEGRAANSCRGLFADSDWRPLFRTGAARVGDGPIGARSLLGGIRPEEASTKGTEGRTMKRRMILLRAGMEVTLVLLAVYFEPTHVVRGTLRGEAFYDGKPTSYWRGVVERDLKNGPPDLPV